MHNGNQKRRLIQVFAPLAALLQCSKHRRMFIFTIILLSILTFNHGAPPSNPFSSLPTNGPIDDATCNMEDLERANDSQLHTILVDLVKTSFFRHFIVDLDHKCPLRSWRQKTSSSDSDELERLLEGQDEDDEEVFECSGGDEDEMDADAEPLCHVLPGGDGDGTFNPFGPMDSNALFSLSQDGFKSKEQQNTFAWKQHSDMVVTSSSSSSSSSSLVDEESCTEDEPLLPDSFWDDICSYIQVGDGTSVVNLALNPERNTGYNGTHIWRAIYEENCVTVDGSDAAMCFEERVLYRLFSGLHTSTTVAIAKHYYPPSKRKNRTDWEPNPQFFMDRFATNPDYIRNLHFSYVVMLRALSKAAPFLYKYEINTGDVVSDETATFLLRRLLDSSILDSCSSVFSAFDESLMFQDVPVNLDAAALQQNFKGVFHNVSSILDCVQCQQCKLHGKLAMLGYGAALKLLFMRTDVVILERNEIVALVNTIAKLSESIRDLRRLTDLYWIEQQEKVKHVQQATQGMLSSSPSIAPSTDVINSEENGGVPAAWQHRLASTENEASSLLTSIEAVDKAVGVAAALGKSNVISFEQEAELVKLAFARNTELLILARHYDNNLDKFLSLSQSIIGNTALVTSSNDEPDAIVVGSGLAGLAATLSILDRGGRVLVIEKEHLLGGNSNKASSGINACCPDQKDDLELFRNDTTRSAGKSARNDLIETLVENSAAAVEWLKTRLGVDLSLLAQLGGHSAKRTHRPSNGMAGAEIIYGIQKAVKAYEKTGQVEIRLDTRVTGLLTDVNGRVTGVKYVTADDSEIEQKAKHVVLATGGFAADRSAGSFLEKYRPELLRMPTTAGAFSTGDGVNLATALGAGTVDMDKVQLHPTGWVDPADPENPSKILAAELLRGIGGILLNASGERFCNELGNRAYVTDKMLSHNSMYAKSGKWDFSSKIPVFNLILSSSAVEDGKKHVDLYTHKGLLTRVEGVSELSDFIGVRKNTTIAVLTKYQTAAKNGVDEFGKTMFRGLPKTDLDSEVFFVGKVTPVLHYCMGGVTIDRDGHVVKENGDIIPGLFAVGEVTGGVHGVNRLAGNSLLECTVFGRRVGNSIPVTTSTSSISNVQSGIPQLQAQNTKSTELRSISLPELEKHNTKNDCWVAIHGVVYDLTEFAEEHPAGPQSIYDLAGKDGTTAFAAVHNKQLLDDFLEDRVGIFESN